MSGADESVSEREERLGRNEALFRAINEKIESLNEIFSAVAADGFGNVCECGDAACIEQIEIDPDAYSRIRADPTLFILVPGHQVASVESVVEEDHPGYVVVRKRAGVPTDALTGRRGK